VTALAFLSPTAAFDGPIARSPMERLAHRAGARFEVRDGWNVPVRYEGEAAQGSVVGSKQGSVAWPAHGSMASPTQGSVAWADVSHLRKWEVQGSTSGEFGVARRDGEAWVCPLTATRALVIGGSEPPDGALDVTCNYAALTILGSQAHETIARFCALDLRPHVAPSGSFRPGSIARQPGMIVVEAENRYLLLFGWAIGEYMWTVVEDAARPRGGTPIGFDALQSHPAAEVTASA
jgi:glycine cleavage system aminomethyltransferase T